MTDMEQEPDPWAESGEPRGMTWEEMREADLRLDAEQEQRDAKAEAEGERQEQEDGDCHAEFVDGDWTHCGCEECDDREADDRREAEELGVSW